MSLNFTYRIRSNIAWVDVVEEPDKEEVTSNGLSLIDQGNHTVSDPVVVDDYTKEWTLTFPTFAAWEHYNDVMFSSTSRSDTTKDGFTVSVVSVPTE
jgi:hypothetical protein